MLVSVSLFRLRSATSGDPSGGLVAGGTVADLAQELAAFTQMMTHMEAFANLMRARIMTGATQGYLPAGSTGPGVAGVLATSPAPLADGPASGSEYSESDDVGAFQ